MLAPSAIITPAPPIVVSPVVTPVVSIPILTEHSQVLVCPRCRVQGLSKVSHEPSNSAIITGAILCFLGCLCLSLIPCCIMQDTVHQCRNCDTVIGRALYDDL